jgi:hypothetical protein
MKHISMAEIVALAKVRIKEIEAEAATYAKNAAAEIAKLKAAIDKMQPAKPKAAKAPARKKPVKRRSARKAVKRKAAKHTAPPKKALRVPSWPKATPVPKPAPQKQPPAQKPNSQRKPRAAPKTPIGGSPDLGAAG